MKLRTLIYRLSVLCLLFGCVCSSFAESGKSLYLDAAAFDPSVFFAQVNSLGDEKKLRDEILNKVVKQIAMREKIFVRYTVTGNVDADETLLRKSVLLDYDQKNALAVIENLEILKIRKSDASAQGLVRYQQKTKFVSPNISVSTKVRKDGNPEWISKPPKTSEFFFAVGSVSGIDPSGLAGFDGSDSVALAALSVWVSKPVVSGKTRMYEAVLTGAYIARRWYNSRENRFYSLSIISRK
jgi:hypothetical protein